MLNGVSAARRNSENPASIATARMRASPACAPRPNPIFCANDAGMSNRRIAETLAISRRTVETHIASVFDRFDLSSRVQLVDLVASLPSG
jgi:DNA-binding NarL/FixJ family response regulator